MQKTVLISVAIDLYSIQLSYNVPSKLASRVSIRLLFGFSFNNANFWSFLLFFHFARKSSAFDKMDGGDDLQISLLHLIAKGGRGLFTPSPITVRTVP